jgi:regulator of replication initiation timing
MNQDITDALARLTHAIENSAPHVAPLQASSPTDAKTLQLANDLLRTRLAEQEQIVADQRTTIARLTAEIDALRAACEDGAKLVPKSNR